jgi:hypothetical protein
MAVYHNGQNMAVLFLTLLFGIITVKYGCYVSDASIWQWGSVMRLFTRKSWKLPNRTS